MLRHFGQRSGSYGELQQGPIRSARIKLTPNPEVFEGSTRIHPPLTLEHRAVRGGIQHPKTSVLLGVRVHGTLQPV